MELKLERRGEEISNPFTTRVGVTTVEITPPINEDYWEYRVWVSETQAVVGFPKFGTVGVGFAVEEDWNTNLPYRCGAREIMKHILHNKGDDSIPDERVLAAIRLIQEAAYADNPGAEPLEGHEDSE